MGLCTPNNTMFVDGNSIDEVDPFASEEWSCEEQRIKKENEAAEKLSTLYSDVYRWWTVVPRAITKVRSLWRLQWVPSNRITVPDIHQ